MRSKAAILVIGAEVLSGKVRDENGPYLITELRRQGIWVTELRVIDDGVELIALAIRSLRESVRYIFTTGGVGPTHDDVTIAGVARAYGVPVVRDDGLAARLHEKFGPNPGAFLKMAEIPQGATLHLDEEMVVPTVQFQETFVLPGVPFLMRQCFERVRPLLEGSPIHASHLWLRGSESEVADILTEVQTRWPAVGIGSYPHFEGGLRVKVTLDASDATAFEGCRAELAQRLASWLVT